MQVLVFKNKKKFVCKNIIPFGFLTGIFLLVMVLEKILNRDQFILFQNVRGGKVMNIYNHMFKRQTNSHSIIYNLISVH